LERIGESHRTSTGAAEQSAGTDRDIQGIEPQAFS
jgi:hypothetical protein